MEHVEYGTGFHDDWFRRWRLIRCPSCRDVTLLDTDWRPGDDERDARVLYPMAESAPEGLPASIAAEYASAMKLKNVDSNAFAVGLGRVLDLVCVDIGAKGRTLGDKLQNLRSNKRVSGRLSDILAGLKDMRNVGAHAELGSLTATDVPIVHALVRTLLEYFYTAPLILGFLQDRLECFRKEDHRVQKSPNEGRS